MNGLLFYNITVLKHFGFIRVSSIEETKTAFAHWIKGLFRDRRISGRLDEPANQCPCYNHY